MNIEVDVYEGQAYITNSSKVQMYAGDRGTPVHATVILSAEELKSHIFKLIKAWKSLESKGGNHRSDSCLPR